MIFLGLATCARMRLLGLRKRERGLTDEDKNTEKSRKNMNNQDFTELKKLWLKSKCSTPLEVSKMLRFLLLLPMALSHRVAIHQASQVTQVVAAKGEKCGDTSCGEGLICSPGSKTCKPALMSPCTRTKWDAFGKTECAGTSTYNRVTMCPGCQR